jgi:membrane-anchored protein YejM (alkaline phosphatase superfamily)
MKRQMMLEAFKWHDNRKNQEREKIIYMVGVYLIYFMIASQFILLYNNKPIYSEKN